MNKKSKCPNKSECAHIALISQQKPITSGQVQTGSDTKKLWIRKLSCGHKRETSIAFMSGIYAKPIVGHRCFCRDCMKEVEIIEVCEASEKEIKKLEKFMEK